MSLVTLPAIAADPVSITSSVLNGKVDPLATDYNGNIQNVNIAAGAGIVYSKLTLTDSVVNADINSAAAIVASKLDLSPVAQTIEMSSKAILEAKGADIASATTTTIWATDGNFMHITGTTTITGFGTATQIGEQRTIVFDGILTLTHNATSLILPTGANITTAAGDTAIVRAETTANARVVAYLRKDGTPLIAATAATALSGSVVQTVTTTYVGESSPGTTLIPLDDTTPLWNEGVTDAGLDQAITPNNSSNTLIIDYNIVCANSGAGQLTLALFQDPTGTDACKAAIVEENGADGLKTLRLRHIMAAGTTSATTFKIRIGGNSTAANYFNRRSDPVALFGNLCSSNVTIQEIKA